MSYAGTDISVSNGEIDLVYGDFALVSGDNNFIQGVITRMQTPIGSLFYDTEYGTRLFDFIQAEATELNLIDYEQEIRGALEMEPLVDNDSIKVSVSFNISDGIKANATFNELGFDTTHNLVVAAGKTLQIWEE